MVDTPQPNDTSRRCELAVWALSPLVLAICVAYLAGSHAALDLTALPGRRLADAVASALALVGAALATWFLATACAARMVIQGTPGARLARRSLSWGSPLVRRAILGTTSLALLPGLAVTPLAVADDGPTPPARQELPADLGWGTLPAPAPSSQPTGQSEDPAPPADTPPPPPTQDAPGDAASPAPAPAPPASVTPETPATETPSPATPSAPSSTPDPLPPTPEPQPPAHRVPALPDPVPAPTGFLSADLGWGATTLATRPPLVSPSATPSPSPTADRAPLHQAPTARPAQPAAPSATATIVDPDSEAAPDTSPYVVAPGDSLWSIAAAHLGADATPAEIDAGWRALYRANAEAVSTPSLIYPGQTLDLTALKDLP